MRVGIAGSISLHFYIVSYVYIESWQNHESQYYYSDIILILFYFQSTKLSLLVWTMQEKPLYCISS